MAWNPTDARNQFCVPIYKNYVLFTFLCLCFWRVLKRNEKSQWTFKTSSFICVKQVKQQFTTCKKSSTKIVKLFYPSLPSCIHIFLSQFIVFILSYHKEKVGHCRECLPPTSVVRVRCLVFPGSPVFPFIKKRSQIPIWSSTQSTQFLTVLTTTFSWESLWITLWKQG